MNKINPLNTSNQNYQVVMPQNYTPEHQRHIENAKHIVNNCSKLLPKLPMGLMNTELKGIIATNFGAQICGIKSGNDYAGMDYKDCPIDEIAEQAEQINTMYATFVAQSNPAAETSVLNIYNYANGLTALLSTNKLFCHHPSQSILGVASSYTTIEFKALRNAVSEHLLRFGAVGSKTVGRRSPIAGVELSNYEQELCFLLLIRWNADKIADFMNDLYRKTPPYSAKIIRANKNAICRKLQLPNTKLSTLLEYLVATEFHHNLPQSFCQMHVGLRVLHA